jgi:hypothetical protein
MHSLETIQKINHCSRKVQTNFNRDSSFCRSSQGFVLHSAVHRSTVFVSKLDHPECFQVCVRFFARASQPARNGFIEALVEGLDPSQARLNGIARNRKPQKV